MDELVVKLLEMDMGRVTAFGPVDISLLEIARRNARSQPTCADYGWTSP